MRRSIACLIIAGLAVPALSWGAVAQEAGIAAKPDFHAQAPQTRAPSAPTPPAAPPLLLTEADVAREAERIAQRDFYLKPETERAARESEAKMDSIAKRMDARVRRATRSICDGCVGAKAAPRIRYGSAEAGLDREPQPRDPAQAPVD